MLENSHAGAMGRRAGQGLVLVGSFVRDSSKLSKGANDNWPIERRYRKEKNKEVKMYYRNNIDINVRERSCLISTVSLSLP
jgi:hypothetical protein